MERRVYSFIIRTGTEKVMKNVVVAALSLASLFVVGRASAQEYPNRVVSLVVPFTPGGIADSGGRIIAKALGAKLGQSVIVENKSGAGGIVGAEFVVNAKPDGYTLLAGSNGALASYPFLFKKPSYDPAVAFQPVHGIGKTPLLIAVRSDSPYKTLADLVDFGKKNPGKINYVTVGHGSAHHLTGELLQKAAGFTMTAIPYKGAAPATVDFLAGVVDIMVDYQLQMGPLIADGKVRALAIASEERVPGLPDVPTFAEQGYPDVVYSAWTVVLAPANTPKPIVEKLSAAISELLKDPEVKRYYADRGSVIMNDATPDVLAKFLDAERVKTKELLDRAGIVPE